MKTGIVIGSIVVALAPIPEKPIRVITATQGLVESLMLTQAIHTEICNRHFIEKAPCERLLSEEIKSVRQLVDEVCEEKAPPEHQDECINQGMEYILDTQIIPGKIKLLNTKRI